MSFWAGGSASKANFLSLKNLVGSFCFDEEPFENLYGAWKFIEEQ